MLGYDEHCCCPSPMWLHTCHLNTGDNLGTAGTLASEILGINPDSLILTTQNVADPT